MTAIRFSITCLSILGLLCGGCSKKPAPVAGEIPFNAPVIKVAVFADGRIIADGQPVTIEALQASFKELAKQKGYVWYYQEQPGLDSSLQTRQVMQAIKDTPLSFTFSVRPDFSDLISLRDKPNKQ